MDNNLDGFYIAPAFMDKLVVHICKNFMTLPNIKVYIKIYHSFVCIIIEVATKMINSSELCIRFLLFWVFGEVKVRENHFNVSLSLPKWESRKLIHNYKLHIT